MTFEAPYAGYAYAYPHKTAYRAIDPPIALRRLWATEQRESLFLYLHVPFCEMRCGFCNLFTTANPQAGLEQSYLEAMHRQAVRVRDALGDVSFARLAIGGGTPTFLDVGGLQTLFEIVDKIFGIDPHCSPVSIETSPLTAEADKLHLLREHGVERISIGVQSFIESEARAAGRSQKTVVVQQALDRIREVGFPTLNIDLIYGLPGQTVNSWAASLQAALKFSPEEIYLYPLYIRPLTGLGRRREEAGDQLRLDCYRLGRTLLLDAGYRQVSMRMFQLQSAAIQTSAAYCCQNDGMVGVGCGARSYTRALHYSSQYAVGSAGILDIITNYIATADEAFGFAKYGFILDEDEQRRRFVIQSLLQVEGLSLADYRARFSTDPEDDLPEMLKLEVMGMAVQQAGHWRLTEIGLEMSDAIGPYLYSNQVRERMAGYKIR